MQTNKTTVPGIFPIMIHVLLKNYIRNPKLDIKFQPKNLIHPWPLDPLIPPKIRIPISFNDQPPYLTCKNVKLNLKK